MSTTNQGQLMYWPKRTLLEALVNYSNFRFLAALLFPAKFLYLIVN